MLLGKKKKKKEVDRSRRRYDNDEDDEDEEESKVKGNNKTEMDRRRIWHDDEEDEEEHEDTGPGAYGLPVRSPLYGYEAELRDELDKRRHPQRSSTNHSYPSKENQDSAMSRQFAIEGYDRRPGFGYVEDPRMKTSLARYQPRREYQENVKSKQFSKEECDQHPGQGYVKDPRTKMLGFARPQSISPNLSKIHRNKAKLKKSTSVEDVRPRMRENELIARRDELSSSRPRRPDSERSVTASNNKIVVAAIDFGTTYSGYAFSFKHEYKTDPLKMHANSWTNVGQGNMNSKTSTCLLLDPDRNLDSFGNDAKAKYESLLEENEHGSWYFFREFKMTLHQEKEIRGNYMLTEENGKTLDALSVFSLSIHALKSHLMTVLRNGHPDVTDSDVMWVITVPAIWNDSAKKFMRLAAEKAGINKDSIDIALEPEAASIFCRQLPITRDPQTELGMTKFPAGTRYMILDCGGGTVDVTVHEVLEDNNLKELHKATGGDWGGTVVNKEFLKFVSNFVGPDVFGDFSNRHKSDYFEMLNEFESKKRMGSTDSSQKVTIRIPATLQKLFQDVSNRPISAQVEQSNYQNKLTISGDKLRIDADLFKSFFKKAVWDITVHVGNITKSIPRPIQAIIMVGGFSESPILQKAIKNSFDSMVEVFVPVEASLCVMKGAVLYGHRPSKITERKSRYTYGVAMTVPFSHGNYPQNRKVISDGKEWCDNVFDIHIRSNQSVKTNEVQATKTYYPMSTADTFLPLYIFRSTDADPKFVDEKNCDSVGSFRVRRNPGTGETTKKDALKVRFIFGGSDIKVEAFKTDGTVQKAEFKMRD